MDDIASHKVKEVHDDLAIYFCKVIVSNIRGVHRNHQINETNETKPNWFSFIFIWFGYSFKFFEIISLVLFLATPYSFKQHHHVKVHKFLSHFYMYIIPNNYMSKSFLFFYGEKACVSEKICPKVY